MAGREIGEYWEETVDDRPVWMIRARTGTFVRYCELDAAASAANAVKESVRHQEQMNKDFRFQVEALMEAMLPSYDLIEDVAADVAMYAHDYESRVLQQ